MNGKTLPDDAVKLEDRKWAENEMTHLKAHLLIVSRIGSTMTGAILSQNYVLRNGKIFPENVLWNVSSESEWNEILETTCAQLGVHCLTKL